MKDRSGNPPDLPDQEFHIGIKALITNGNGEILLLKSGPAEQKHTNVEFWDLPGGRIKAGASIEDTLKREIEEELGVSGQHVEVGEVFDASISKFKASKTKDLGLMLIVYHCRLNGAQEFRLSDEHSEWKWFPTGEAKGLLGVKFAQGFLDKLDLLGKN